MIGRASLAALLAPSLWATAALAEPFRFESETSLQDMDSLVKRDITIGMPRAQVRAIFVQQGGATLKAHPNRADVEKYIYDIDLCSYYVWRWNISADYDAKGGLKQIYVNATPTLANAPLPPLPSKGPFFMLTRPRPQAFKGESSLKAVITDKLILTGVGPTRADPLDMGRAINYHGEVWRSIFDADYADRIAPYAGDCATVDAKYEELKAAAAKAAPLAAPSR
jgi:hypothetical protein